jgi:hypothetical protein
MFAIILWFIFFGFKIHEFITRTINRKIEEQDTCTKPCIYNHKPMTHQSIFEDYLKDFHKAQCFFSGTIQVAALTYGIFDTDMLVTFILVPLATNGVLPVVFTLVLLYKRDEKLDIDIILFTVVCWILSSLVYWTLYSHIIPINGNAISGELEYGAYRQFYYRLSALDACGGYSALAACPNKFRLGRGEITTSSYRIRVLTPVIWTFSTVCLLAILVARVFNVRLSHAWDKLTGTKQPSQQSPSNMEKVMPRNDATSNATNALDPQHTSQEADSWKSKCKQLATIHNFVYVLVTMCFLAGAGMQLSLLSVATSLDMMDREDWEFGQVVAITIWIPPLIAYLYRELEFSIKKRKIAKPVSSDNKTIRVCDRASDEP